TMPDIATILPPRRPDLLLRALYEQGEYVDVVTDPRTGAIPFDEEEDILDCQLDGVRDATAICRAFTERFAGPLSEEDFDQFIELVRVHGFLLPAEETALPAWEASANIASAADLGANTFRASIIVPLPDGAATLGASIGGPENAGSIDVRTPNTAGGA